VEKQLKPLDLNADEYTKAETSVHKEGKTHIARTRHKKRRNRVGQKKTGTGHEQKKITEGNDCKLETRGKREAVEKI